MAMYEYPGIKADLRVYRDIGEWKTLAVDELDNIGAWRWTTLTARRRRDKTYDVETRKKLFDLTVSLSSAMHAYFKPIDPTPIEDMFEPIGAWLKNDKPKTIPPQEELERQFERAFIRLEAVETVITERLRAARAAANQVVGAVALGGVPSATCCVTITGKANEVTINGESKHLPAAQFKVIKALVEAWPNRLTLTQLDRKSSTESPAKPLKALAKKSAAWAAAILFPAAHGEGYGLADSPQLPTTPHKNCP